MTWTGPHRILGAVSPFVYRVESMLAVPGRRREIKVHVVRIRRFSNGALGTEIDTARLEESARRDYPDNVVLSHIHTYA